MPSVSYSIVKWVEATSDRLIAHIPGRYTAKTNFGARFHAVGLDDFITRRLLLFGFWEPSLTAFFSRRLRLGDIFVDIGANIGYYTLLASNLVGSAGQVFAYEASPVIYKDLLVHLTTNGASNVVAVNVAVGSQSGTAPLYFAPKGNAGLTSVVAREGLLRAEHTVRLAALADLLDEVDLGRVRLIKIDIEGGEPPVLASLSTLLGRLRQDAEIAVEFWPGCGPALDPFLRAGFHIFVVENDYGLGGYLRHRIEPPRRLDRLPERKVDLILSRADVSEL